MSIILLLLNFNPTQLLTILNAQAINFFHLPWFLPVSVYTQYNIAIILFSIGATEVIAI